MRSFLILFVTLMSILSIPVGIFASETNANQVQAIIKFYEIMAKKEPPSVADYFGLFGKDNEAELEMNLRQKFPSLPVTGKWFENQEASKYINNIYKHPESHPSLFLERLRSIESELFNGTTKHLIEFPPNIKNDLRKYKVIHRGKELTFEFSQNDIYIENIYLPDGKSIYTLIKRNKGQP
jgi:hypothetical protein